MSIDLTYQDKVSLIIQQDVLDTYSGFDFAWDVMEYEGDIARAFKKFDGDMENFSVRETVSNACINFLFHENLLDDFIASDDDGFRSLMTAAFLRWENRKSEWLTVEYDQKFFDEEL